MNIVYNLIITVLKLSCENHNKDFNIGFFTSSDKAFDTAKLYLKSVEGFNKYHCKHKIIQKKISDYNDKILYDSIYIIYGWNFNDIYDETDVVESDCFITEEAANIEFDRMKQKYNRAEWCIDKYKLDECNWGAGFVQI